MRVDRFTSHCDSTVQAVGIACAWVTCPPGSVRSPQRIAPCPNVLVQNLPWYLTLGLTCCCRKLPHLAASPPDQWTATRCMLCSFDTPTFPHLATGILPNGQHSVLGGVQQPQVVGLGACHHCRLHLIIPAQQDTSRHGKAARSTYVNASAHR
jgi:hypothetical protein